MQGIDIGVWVFNTKEQGLDNCWENNHAMKCPQSIWMHKSELHCCGSLAKALKLSIFMLATIVRLHWAAGNTPSDSLSFEPWQYTNDEYISQIIYKQSAVISYKCTVLLAQVHKVHITYNITSVPLQQVWLTIPTPKQKLRAGGHKFALLQIMHKLDLVSILVLFGQQSLKWFFPCAPDYQIVLSIVAHNIYTKLTLFTKNATLDIWIVPSKQSWRKHFPYFWSKCRLTVFLFAQPLTYLPVAFVNPLLAQGITYPWNCSWHT